MEIKIDLPQGESINVVYEDDTDIVIKEVLYNGNPVYNLLLSLNTFKGFNVTDYIFEKLLRASANAKLGK